MTTSPDATAERLAATIRERLWARHGGWSSCSVSWPEAADDGSVGTVKLGRDNEPLEPAERAALEELVAHFSRLQGRAPEALDLFFGGDGAAAGIEPYWAPAGGNARIEAGVDGATPGLSPRLSAVASRPALGRFLRQLDARVCTAAKSLAPEDAAAFTGERGDEAESAVRRRVAAESAGGMGTVAGMTKVGDAIALLAAWARIAGQPAPVPADEATSRKIMKIAATSSPEAAAARDLLPSCLEDVALDLIETRFG